MSFAFLLALTPDLLLNLAIQVPALAVVVYLVIHFLSYIKEMRSEDRKFVSDLVIDYKATVHKCDETIEKNTRAVQTFNDSIRQRDSMCPMVSGKHLQPKPRADGE